MNGKRTPRRLATRLHRYAGLLLAGFLTVAGLTGSVIAFHHELDAWLNPEVFKLTRTGDPLPVEDWIEAAEGAYPHARVSFVTVPQSAREPATLFLEPKPEGVGGSSTRGADHIDQVFVHPDTAKILGARDRNGFRFDRLHAMPFLYTLHYSLHLGQWGMWFLGGLALIWVFDCFVGLYLAWPARMWSAIKQAFSVKSSAGRARVQYDLHRAGGLWFWILLLVLAFSGVSMNLHDEVFDPAVNAVAPMTPWPGDAAPDREDPAAPLAARVSEVLAASARALQGGGLSGDVGAVWLNYAKGLYHIGYHTKEDIMAAHPGAWVSFSVAKGDVIDVRPAGGHTFGDLVHDWQFPLHSGKAFGLTGRIIVSVTGVIVAMLSVTGVLIWWRKRGGRRVK